MFNLVDYRDGGDGFVCGCWYECVGGVNKLYYSQDSIKKKAIE